MNWHKRNTPQSRVLTVTPTQVHIEAKNKLKQPLYWTPKSSGTHQGLCGIIQNARIFFLAHGKVVILLQIKQTIFFAYLSVQVTWDVKKKKKELGLSSFVLEPSL